MLAPAREAGTGKPTVVHVVRAANGVGALRRFAEAMRLHDPGLEYELVLGMKGFPSLEEAQPYLDEVADLSPAALFFPDVGFDLGVYFGAAAQLRRERYCFMNSWTRPVADGWLAKLDAALASPDVGMAGAFGSWGSVHSWLTYSLGLPSAYRAILPPRQEGRRQMREMELELQGDVPDERPGRLGERLQLLERVPEILLGFRPFPNPHLRTSAFMISHAALMRVKLTEVGTNRMQTFALEAGRDGVTRQLERLGLHVLVVDRDGAAYEPPAWDRSQTFRQGDQEGLLMRERRTLEYDRASTAQRRLMAVLSWGPNADPRPARERSASET